MEQKFPTLGQHATIDDVCTMAGCIFRILGEVGVKIDEERLREMLVNCAAFAPAGDPQQREMFECILSAAFPPPD